MIKVYKCPDPICRFTGTPREVLDHIADMATEPQCVRHQKLEKLSSRMIEFANTRTEEKVILVMGGTIAANRGGTPTKVYDTRTRRAGKNLKGGIRVWKLQSSIR